MRFPDMDIPWVFPVTHERKLYSGRVFEIQYSRILVALVFSLLLFIYSFVIFDFLVSFILFITLALTSALLFPLFISPWDIVLSNKRFIVRKRFWNIGFFSKVRSFNLTYLETIIITPRIKIGSILLGFLILQQSLSILDFSFTGVLSFPIEIEIVLFFLDSVGGDISSQVNTFVFQLLTPFQSLLPIIGILLLFLGGGLFLFGFPHRSELELRTTGGSIFRINAGIPRDLHTLLASVSRKNRISHSPTNWTWDPPLLEGEVVTFRTQLGFIDKKSQLFGLLALALFINSLNDIIFIIQQFSINTLFIGFFRIISMFFILNTIRFSKRYIRFAVTNRRLIIQQERQLVSGLWGQRVYSYTDLPLNLLQGFNVRHFSGVSLSGILMMIIALLLSIYSFIHTNNEIWFIIGTVTIVTLFLINFRTFTDISFLTSSGTQMRFGYRILGLLSWLSHKMEEKTIRGIELYRIFFPNILNEDKILGLYNACRAVNPESKTFHKDISHVIKYEHFLDKNEKVIATIKKYGPIAYQRQSVLIGVILSLIAIFIIQERLVTHLRILFVLFSLTILFFVSISQLIDRYRSLIFLERASSGARRLIFVEEIIPRKVAQSIGVLPERFISEIKNNSILGIQYHMNISNRALRNIFPILLQFLLTFSGLFIVYSYHDAQTPWMDEFLSSVAFFLNVFVISLIPRIVRAIFSLIPRYSLSINGRFFSLTIPYMAGAGKINEVL